MNILQDNNRVINKKKGKGELPLFHGNVERVIPIYGHGQVLQLWIKLLQWFTSNKFPINNILFTSPIVTL